MVSTSTSSIADLMVLAGSTMSANVQENTHTKHLPGAQSRGDPAVIQDVVTVLALKPRGSRQFNSMKMHAPKLAQPLPRMKPKLGVVAADVSVETKKGVDVVAAITWAVLVNNRVPALATEVFNQVADVAVQVPAAVTLTIRDVPVQLPKRAGVVVPVLVLATLVSPYGHRGEMSYTEAKDTVGIQKDVLGTGPDRMEKGAG
jgi:hypothetical protein